jgi:hypothetical protein
MPEDQLAELRAELADLRERVAALEGFPQILIDAFNGAEPLLSGAGKPPCTASASAPAAFSSEQQP